MSEWKSEWVRESRKRIVESQEYIFVFIFRAQKQHNYLNIKFLRHKLLIILLISMCYLSFLLCYLNKLLSLSLTHSFTYYTTNIQQFHHQRVKWTNDVWLFTIDYYVIQLIFYGKFSTGFKLNMNIPFHWERVKREEKSEKIATGIFKKVYKECINWKLLWVACERMH